MKKDYYLKMEADESLENYEKLKQEFKIKSISDEDLSHIKEYYKNDIASKRLMACIQDIDDLFDVLERRDVISEDHTEEFKTIGHLINNASINNTMVNKGCSSKPSNFVNQYALEKLRDDMEQKLRIQNQTNENNQKHVVNCNCVTKRIPSKDDTARIPNNNPVNSVQFEGKYKIAIQNLVAREIGRQWRDFGRGLNIREGPMDNLELEYPKDVKTRVFKLFELFEEFGHCDPKKHVIVICEALRRNCRRNDLANNIQEMLVM